MSNRDELTLFSYEILGLVGRTGAAPHDLLRMARRGRMLDWAGESQYYVEPKRLARLGYLEARKEPGRTRERTVYTLTDQGLEALRPGRGRPCTSRRSRARPGAPARRRPGRRAGDAREHGHAARRHRRPAGPARETEAAADDLPHRRKYLLLVTGFMRRLFELHLDLVDEVERELDGPAT